MNDETARRIGLKERETYFFARALFPCVFAAFFLPQNNPPATQASQSQGWWQKMKKKDKKKRNCLVKNGLVNM